MNRRINRINQSSINQSITTGPPFSTFNKQRHITLNLIEIETDFGDAQS